MCLQSSTQEFGHLPAVLYRQLPAVLKRVYPAGDVYLRWLLHRAWQDACHLENYLRCYRLHGGCGFEYTSGGSCGRACIIPPKSRGHLPPVGQRCLPAVLWVVYLRSSVLAGRCLPAVLISTCGALDVYLRWFRLHSAGVNLSIPPVAPADVPAMYRPLIGTSTCGAKIYHIEPDTARSPIVSARRKGAKVTPRPQRNTEQMETDRRARCGGTIEVGAMYGDCKRKRVGKDFSAFVHTKTAKPFGNY